MAHKSSLGLLMAPYIILSLVIGPARSCTISTPRGALQPCGASNLTYNNLMSYVRLFVFQNIHVGLPCVVIVIIETSLK